MVHGHRNLERRGRTAAPARLMRVLAGLMSFAMLGGLTLNLSTCCEKDFCSNLRTIEGYIAKGYAQCCQKPAAQQDACFDALDQKTDKSYELIVAAKTACESGDDDLAKDLMNRLRDIWLPTPKPSASGRIENELVALGRQDWLDLDVTLPRGSGAGQPVSIALVNDQYMNPEATGIASEDGLEGSGASEVPAVIIPASGAQPFLAWSYEIPTGTQFNMRYGDELSGLSLTGSIAVVQTATTPASGSATVGVPTGMHWRISYMGQVLDLDLDKTSPYNSLTLDSNGDGTLGVALKLTSNSHYLVGLVHVGSTLYFTFPIHMSAGWADMRIHSDPSLPGDFITPTDPIALDGADLPYTLTALPSDRCSDNDGNGIRDGADEVNNAMRTAAGCSAQH